jgi:hypothetical protein
MSSLQSPDFEKALDGTIYLQIGQLSDLTYVGGTSPVSFTVLSGDVSVNGGRFKAGTQPGSARIRAVDSNSKILDFDIEIYAPLALDPSSSQLEPNSLSDTDYTVTGGIAPYSVSGSDDLSIAGDQLHFTGGWAARSASQAVHMVDAIGNTLDLSLDAKESALRFATSADDTGLQLASGADGFFVVGSTTGDLTSDAPGGGADIYVSYFDYSGHRIFEKEWGSSQTESFGAAIVDDAHGFIYLVGSTTGSPAGTNLGHKDAFVLKLDFEGNVVCQNQVGTANDDEFLAGALLSDGSLILTGSTTGGWQGGFTPRTYGSFFPTEVADGVIVRMGADCTQGAVVQIRDPGPSLATYVRKVYIEGSEYWIESKTSDVEDPVLSTFVQKRSIASDAVNDEFQVAWNRSRVDDWYVSGSSIYYLLYKNIDGIPAACSSHTGVFGFLLYSSDLDGNDQWCVDADLGNGLTGGFNKLFPSSDGSKILLSGAFNVSYRSQTQIGAYDAVVTSFDLNGNSLNSRQFGSSVDDSATSLVSIPGSSDILMLFTSAGTMFDFANAGSYDAFVVRTNSNFDFR